MLQVGEKINVAGTAIVAGISRNKIKYTDEELQKGSKSLKNVTIIKDHHASVDNSVGRVEKQSYANKKQLYNGWVEEDGTNVVQKIKDKRLKVSVGAIVEQLVQEKKDSDVLTAKGIRYMELSLTPTPGIPDATIETGEKESCGVTESIDLKQLKTKLSEQEIDSLLESFDDEFDEPEKSSEEENETTSEDNEESKMDEEKKEAPAEEPKTEAPVEEPKTEAPTEEKPVEAPVEEPKKEEPAEEKKDEATEMVKSLVKENLELKEKMKVAEAKKAEAQKVQEEKKMDEQKEVVETKTQKDVVKEKVEFDNYVIETDQGKNAFYKEPSADGTYE